MRRQYRWIGTFTLIAAGLALGAAQGIAEPAPAGALETLPAAHASGDFSVTLTALKANLPSPDGANLDDPNESAWTEADVKLDWGGKPLRDWALQHVTVLDEAGHTFTPKRTSTHFDGKGNGEIRFAGPAWPAGGTWKLRFEFARTSAFPSPDFWNAFRPEELLLVKRLAIPAPGQVNQLDAVATALDARVQLLGVAGANAKLPGGIPVMRSEPTVHYRIEHPRDTYVTFLRASDPAGNVLSSFQTAMGMGREGERYVRQLKVPAGVTEVYLAFAVQKGRTFEWTVRPE